MVFKNINDEINRRLFNYSVKKKFGKESIHLTISHNLWSLALWDKKDYPELAINDSKLLGRIMKIYNEISSTDRNTVIRPLQLQTVNNILVNGGMNEMGKRSTGETASINAAMAIGIGTTTPTLADFELETEILRNPMGTSQTVGQTEQYATAFPGSDLIATPNPPPQNITESGLFTVATPDTPIMTARVTFTVFVLDGGKIFTQLLNISHQNGTES